MPTAIKTEIKTMPLSSLVLDWSVYPRHELSTRSMASIREAKRAAVELPPIIADKASKRVVDGFGRYHVYAADDGPDCEVRVELRPYVSEAELFRDAVTLNVGRGDDLTRWDLLHSANIAEGLGIGEDAFATWISWTSPTWTAYRKERTVKTMQDGRADLKRSLRHLWSADAELNDRQVAANDHVDGMGQVYHVDQLIWHIGADSLDPTNERLRERAAYLAPRLTEWVEAHPVVEETA
jgi:hypothetical protein